MPKVVFGDPPAVDVRIRRLAQTPSGRAAGRALSPLFPLGLPGGYIMTAYALARWLRREGRRGGAPIVMSAWLGWIVHRAVKVVLIRRRPPRRKRRTRVDSFPSGHTTGATALAITAAIVLRRQGMLSPAAATALAVGVPLIMGAYRVVADDHWATDVVGGWALGSAIALASLRGSRGSPSIRRRPRRVHRAARTSAG
jgi:undecaprenyl-diphosphatase